LKKDGRQPREKLDKDRSKNSLKGCGWNGRQGENVSVKYLSPWRKGNWAIEQN
jgi:hypothetical protein